jgi:hypothetical protein
MRVFHIKIANIENSNHKSYKKIILLFVFISDHALYNHWNLYFIFCVVIDDHHLQKLFGTSEINDA